MSGSKSSARTLKHSLCSLRLSRLEEHYIETLSVLHAFIKARVFTTFLIGLLALSRTVEFICIVCQNPKSCTFKSVKRSKSCMLKSEFNVVDIEIHVGCHTIIIGIPLDASITMDVFEPIKTEGFRPWWDWRRLIPRRRPHNRRRS